MGVLGSNGSRRKHRGRSSRAILPFITAFGAGDTVAYRPWIAVSPLLPHSTPEWTCWTNRSNLGRDMGK
jgi:hypothetical protein